MICVCCENDRHGSDVSWLRGKPICTWCADEFVAFLNVFGFGITFDTESEPGMRTVGSIRCLEEQC